MEQTDMRLPLTNDTRPNTTLPFVDAGVSEVIARVTYQLILLDWRRNPTRYGQPLVGMRQLQYQLQTYQDTFLHTAFASAAAFVQGGKGRLLDWRNGVIYRSRFYMASRRAGKPWARPRTPVLLTGGSDEGHVAAITGSDTVQPYRSTRKQGRNAH